MAGKWVKDKGSDRDVGKAEEEMHITELVTCGQLSLYPYAGFMRTHRVCSGDVPIGYYYLSVLTGSVGAS